MALLSAENVSQVRDLFQALRDPVKLVVFSQSLAAAELCARNESLVREVAATSELISVEVLNLAIDRERAEAYGVTQVPAIVVEGARDYGLRFYGVPTGYEFSNLIDAIVIASTGEATLSDATKTALAGIGSGAGIKGFLPPTRPVCPQPQA